MSARAPQLELPSYDEAGFGEAARVTPFHWLHLAIRAAWRRKAIAAGIFLLGVAGSFAYYSTRTPFYRVRAKILAQRPQALPAAVRPVFDDTPARSAWELIHRRENLLALIRQTNMLAEPGAAPSPRPGLRDWLTRAAAKSRTGAPTAKDQLDTLVLVLDRMLVVQVEDGTISIQLDWPDPQQGYALVQATVQNFIEARHLQEITAIEEVISVLRGRVAALHKNLDEAMEEARRRPTHVARASQPRASLPSEELVRLQSVLESKRRAIRDVEDFRQRRLADLQSQLDQARNTLSDAHPTVIGLRQQIESLNKESPQLQALRAEERNAARAYAERLAREGNVAPPATSTMLVERTSPEEDQWVREVRVQYEQLNARLNAAEVERDAASAAFKYRYNVIWPPQVPREPFGPNPLKILGGGLILSVILALAAAAAPDVLRGRVVERWQVEKGLDLPILAQVRRDEYTPG